MGRIAIWFFTAAVALFRGADVYAYNETLSFRPAQNGAIYAVISGTAPTGFCFIGRWSQPISISVTGNTITIVSDTSGICGIPGPIEPYEVVADLGVLTLPQYQVAWSAGSTTLTAVLLPNALLGAAAVPAASVIALLLVSISIAAAAVPLIRGHG